MSTKITFHRSTLLLKLSFDNNTRADSSFIPNTPTFKVLRRHIHEVKKAERIVQYGRRTTSGRRLLSNTVGRTESTQGGSQSSSLHLNSPSNLSGKLITVYRIGKLDYQHITTLSQNQPKQPQIPIPSSDHMSVMVNYCASAFRSLHKARVDSIQT